VLLYPRLPIVVARDMARKSVTKSTDELRQESSNKHSAVIYAPTGGNRVTDFHLSKIQEAIRNSAENLGYPERLNDPNRRTFDAESGYILHDKMDISPADASSPGVWMFMGCVLLPDIVRWRFPGSAPNWETSEERFLSGNRAGRNTFGRVWWRAYTLYQEDKTQQYELLYALGEDELVQIMERPNIAGSRTLSKQVCISLKNASDRYKNVSRSELLRDAMKRLRRLLSVVSFDAVDENVLGKLVDDTFITSVKALTGANRTVVAPSENFVE